MQSWEEICTTSSQELGQAGSGTSRPGVLSYRPVLRGREIHPYLISATLGSSLLLTAGSHS